MTTTEISSLNRSLETANEWLKSLVDQGPFTNQAQAYAALRAVLHAVRDRLTVEEVTHLGNQLPNLVRGIYYEGWRPALSPNKERTAEAFLDHVRSSLGGDQAQERLDLEESTRAVTRLLEERITEGQARHVVGQLPARIRELWGGEVTV